MTYNSNLQSINDKLQTIYNLVKELPDVDSGEIILQEKTVNPTTSKQTITADNNYDGLSKVTVNAIPNGYTDTSDATATADKIFLNESAYVNGKKITGFFTIDNEISTQTDLISNIQTTLQNKVAGGSGSGSSSLETCTMTFTLNNAITYDITFLLSVVKDGVVKPKFYYFDHQSAITNDNIIVENVVRGSFIAITTLMSQLSLISENCHEIATWYIDKTTTGGIHVFSTPTNGNGTILCSPWED